MVHRSTASHPRRTIFSGRNSERTHHRCKAIASYVKCPTPNEVAPARRLGALHQRCTFNKTALSTRRRTYLLRTTLTMIAILVFGCSLTLAQSPATEWRAATDAELKALLPARATVGKEHIETEMRAASGVTNGHGRFLAGVVLITAGYSADGKYSHYLITQVPVQIGALTLPAGDYVFGWQRNEDQLDVHFYEAATGTSRGSVPATRIVGSGRVESFKIWPPRVKPLIQIGRFGMPYRIPK